MREFVNVVLVSFARLAFHSTVSLLMIALTMMTIAKPAEADGTVTPSWKAVVMSPETWFYAPDRTQIDQLVAPAYAAAVTAGKQFVLGYHCVIVHEEQRDYTWNGLPAGLYFVEFDSSCLSVQATTVANYSKYPFCPPKSGGIPNDYNPTTCSCNTGYRPDSIGKSCINVQYTITLSGGSTTEPWNKKHDQYHKAANLPFVAVVTDQNNQPKAGINVSLSTDVTPNTGGHSHTNGRPKGKLVATPGNPVSAVSTANGGAAISGVTDKSGIVWFTFGAEEASGEHTITANCTGCKAPATSTVKAEIQGLMKLGDDNTCTTSYCLRGGRTPHPDNHYYTGAAESQVVPLANAYQKKFGQLLQINDSSLIKGGLYDYKGNWMPGHEGHRKGVVVDVNNYSAPNPRFEELAYKRHIKAQWHQKGSAPHYHLLLLGKDE